MLANKSVDHQDAVLTERITAEATVILVVAAAHLHARALPPHGSAIRWNRWLSNGTLITGSKHQPTYTVKQCRCPAWDDDRLKCLK